MMGKSTSLQFKKIDTSELNVLRIELAAAGCEFDFDVFHVEDVLRVDESLHKAILDKFFNEMVERIKYRNIALVEKYPEYANKQLFQLTYDIELAKPVVLSHESTVLLRETNGWRSGEAALFSAFRDPPYTTNMNDEQALSKFTQWLDCLGLHLDDSVEVLDWVGNPDTEPERSVWSNYFDEGKGWWGIWCLTIWNPARRTIGILAASATD
jgi:hypothetical protein